MGRRPDSEHHQLTAVLPDEGRQAEDRGLDAQAVLVGRAVAVEVQRQRLCRGEELLPGPVVVRIRQPGGVEEVAVVVDHQAADVLGDAHQLAAPAEGVGGGAEEVAVADEVAAPQVGRQRLEHAHGRERGVAAVVDEHHVGGVAGREVDTQARAGSRTRWGCG